MLIPFGILSSAAGVEVGGDYELIATEILTTSESSITFSNLGDYSSTYKHLQIRFTSRGNRSATTDDIAIRFNGDTNNSNYHSHRLLGHLGSVSAFAAQAAQVAVIPAASETANNFAGGVIDILDPYSTTKNTTVRSFYGHATLWIALNSVLWNNTDSLTSFQLVAVTNELVAGSRFSLYGIKG